MAKSRSRGPNRGGSSTGNAGAQAPAATIAAPEPAAPKKRTNPVQFAKEVRAEARKITWTSRKETWITSVMVFIMVALATVFFALTDLGIGVVVKEAIKIGS
jgi:preprotein translocase subunit SecE